jgi:hypothetical protein
MVKSTSKSVGSRAEVWHGTAKHTSGGLTKQKLFKTKTGRIVSMKKHYSAKRENRLVKHGYGTTKGKFGYRLLNGTKKTRRGRKSRMRGGHASNQSPLSPAGIDGQGITNYGMGSNDVQFAAGEGGGRRRRRRMSKRGGHASTQSPLSPAGIDGQGITNYGMGSNDVQFAAGQAGGRRRRRKSRRTKSRRTKSRRTKSRRSKSRRR